MGWFFHAILRLLVWLTDVLEPPIRAWPDKHPRLWATQLYLYRLIRDTSYVCKLLLDGAVIAQLWLWQGYGYKKWAVPLTAFFVLQAAGLASLIVKRAHNSSDLAGTTARAGWFATLRLTCVYILGTPIALAAPFLLDYIAMATALVPGTAAFLRADGVLATYNSLRETMWFFCLAGWPSVVQFGLYVFVMTKHPSPPLITTNLALSAWIIAFVAIPMLQLNIFVYLFLCTRELKAKLDKAGRRCTFLEGLFFAFLKIYVYQEQITLATTQGVPLTAAAMHAVPLYVFRNTPVTPPALRLLLTVVSANLSITELVLDNIGMEAGHLAVLFECLAPPYDSGMPPSRITRVTLVRNAGLDDDCALQAASFLLRLREYHQCALRHLVVENSNICHPASRVLRMAGGLCVLPGGAVEVTSASVAYSGLKRHFLSTDHWRAFCVALVDNLTGQERDAEADEDAEEGEEEEEEEGEGAEGVEGGATVEAEPLAEAAGASLASVVAPFRLVSSLDLSGQCLRSQELATLWEVLEAVDAALLPRITRLDLSNNLFGGGPEGGSASVGTDLVALLCGKLTACGLEVLDVQGSDMNAHDLARVIGVAGPLGILVHRSLLDASVHHYVGVRSSSRSSAVLPDAYEAAPATAMLDAAECRGSRSSGSSGSTGRPSNGLPAGAAHSHSRSRSSPMDERLLLGPISTFTPSASDTLSSSSHSPIPSTGSGRVASQAASATRCDDLASIKVTMSIQSAVAHEAYLEASGLKELAKEETDTGPGCWPRFCFGIPNHVITFLLAYVKVASDWAMAFKVSGHTLKSYKPSVVVMINHATFGADIYTDVNVAIELWSKPFDSHAVHVIAILVLVFIAVPYLTGCYVVWSYAMNQYLDDALPAARQAGVGKVQDEALGLKQPSRMTWAKVPPLVAYTLVSLPLLVVVPAFLDYFMIITALMPAAVAVLHMQDFMTSYMSTRHLAEVLLESTAQVALQGSLYIFHRVTGKRSAVHNGLLLYSIAMSLINTLRCVLALMAAAKHLKLGTKGYIRYLLQLGAGGLPFDAIKANAVVGTYAFNDQALTEAGMRSLAQALKRNSTISCLRLERVCLPRGAEDVPWFLAQLEELLSHNATLLTLDLSGNRCFSGPEGSTCVLHLAAMLCRLPNNRTFEDGDVLQDDGDDADPVGCGLLQVVMLDCLLDPASAKILILASQLSCIDVLYEVAVVVEPAEGLLKGSAALPAWTFNIDAWRIFCSSALERGCTQLPKPVKESDPAAAAAAAEAAEAASPSPPLPPPPPEARMFLTRGDSATLSAGPAFNFKQPDPDVGLDIDLACCTLTDTHLLCLIESMTAMMPCVRMKRLGLACNPFGDKWMSRLAALVSQRGVEEVDVSGCGLVYNTSALKSELRLKEVEDDD